MGDSSQVSGHRKPRGSSGSFCDKLYPATCAETGDLGSNHPEGFSCPLPAGGLPGVWMSRLGTVSFSLRVGGRALA